MTADAHPMNEADIVALLEHHTYEDAARLSGWSRGRIWRAARAAGARKHEKRIQDRKRKRELQFEVLSEIINETVTADVLDFLDGIPDNSAQMVCTSPPYNIAVAYDAHADNLRHVYYVGWMMMCVSEFARILKPGGTIALEVGTTRDDNDVRIPLQQIFYPQLISAGLTWQNTVPWVAPHGLTPDMRLAERHEDILVFTKGKPAVFNPTPARAPQKHPGKLAFKGPNKGNLSGCALGAHPTDVWADIDHVRHNTTEKTGHPAQFSLALARRLVNLYSLPGDEHGPVIDSFCGSGTVAQACIELGRSFTGADLSYEDLRRERLKSVAPDLVSPLPGVTPESLAIWQAQAARRDIPALPLDYSA